MPVCFPHRINSLILAQDAHALVRVVVGICTMSPSQLGWDTSMSVIKEKEQYTTTFLHEWTPKPSYQVPYNTEKEDHYWVIEMPKPVEAEYGVMEVSAFERFVLFKGLNLQRGQVIRGRATRVWKAWRYDDLPLPPEERKVCLLPRLTHSLMICIDIRVGFHSEGLLARH